MPPEQQFEFLRRWVLPNEDHSEFRLQAGFTPTHPAPILINAPPEDGFRVPAGGKIVAPALDLIDAALSLKQLAELRQQIDDMPIASAENQVGRLALLALIDMRRQEFDSAGSLLEVVFSTALADADLLDRLRDPLLLCVHVAARSPEASKFVLDPAYRITLSYRSVSDRSAWHRHFSGAYARVKRTATEGAAQPAIDATARGRQWSSVIRPNAQYRGAGCPVPVWTVENGQADSLVSHDTDFLYFFAPLRGNFEIEGDLAGFGWRETQLLIAGRWVGPVYDHKSYDLGAIHGYIGRRRVSPPLTEAQDFIHYRTVVRDQVATTWFNGRKIHEEPLPPEHDPWLAVRSTERHDGGVRNLRITGQPTIPDVLRLSDPLALTGWLPYFADSLGADWYYQIRPSGVGEFVGRRRQELPTGCHCESLLVYHRPMLEDGSIEYEFWYEPGQVEVHPALDRLCFLLHPDGVKIHWLTDGRFDRTGLAPDNVLTEPDNRRGPQPLPLHEGQWNRLRLTLVGDRVDLVLNGQLVYQRPVEPGNQRFFGLFHYADRTEMRVRKIIWKGDWPRELPAIGGQELAIDETGFLDQRLAELPAVFSHDFVAEGLPLDRFAVIRGDIPYHVSVEADGLHARRPGTGGYRTAAIAPSLRVKGDFDATATFEQLVTEPPDSCSSTIMLVAIAGREGADEAGIMRRRSLANNKDQHLVQCRRVRHVDGTARYQFFNHQPVEAVSGTLRLARRGDRIYYLFAEADSKNFRLIGDEAFPTDDLQREGLQLMVQIQGDSGSTSVIWKNLSIRAEHLSGLAVEDENQLLKDLNRRRSQLGKTFSQDFTRQGPAEDTFSRWTDRRDWNPKDGGWLIVAPGADVWTSAGARLNKQIAGDFDASIKLDAERLGLPAEDQESSVYLQIELDDAGKTQANVVFSKSPQGATEVFAQLRVPDGKGGYHYRRLGRQSVTSVSGFRLARRGDRIYFLVSSQHFDDEKIIAHADVNRARVPSGGVRILVRTGGAGRTSHVIWKSLRVNAEQITPDSER